MAVYSCAPFFNEFHLLDLKIAEELELVDKLVISEADMTHQGARKPLHLKDNPKYRHPKIELVLLENQFTAADPWKNEALQRDVLMRPFEDDDVFIVTDLDEINNGEDIPTIVDQARTHGLVRLEHTLYYYKINLRVRWNAKWYRGFAASGKYLREAQTSFSELRRKGGDVLLPTRGKHFSYLADPDGIADKIKSFAHSELNKPEYTDPAQIEARIRNHADPFDREFELERVEVDDSYPATILNNMDLWRRYIAEPNAVR